MNHTPEYIYEVSRDCKHFRKVSVFTVMDILAKTRCELDSIPEVGIVHAGNYFIRKKAIRKAREK